MKLSITTTPSFLERSFIRDLGKRSKAVNVATKCIKSLDFQDLLTGTIDRDSIIYHIMDSFDFDFFFSKEIVEEAELLSLEIISE